LEKKNVGVEPSLFRKCVTYRRGKKVKTIIYRDKNPEGDVGDCGIIKKGNEPIRGISDAEFSLEDLK